MSNKGFTLLECLIVLSVISIFSITIPFMKPTSHTILNYQMQTMYEKLLQMQHTAMMQKREVSVDFHGNQYTLDGDMNTWKQGISCTDSSFHFTPLGTVSRAGTATCTLQNAKRSIVIELGSGRMYVR